MFLNDILIYSFLFDRVKSHVMFRCYRVNFVYTLYENCYLGYHFFAWKVCCFALGLIVPIIHSG